MGEKPIPHDIDIENGGFKSPFPEDKEPNSYPPGEPPSLDLPPAYVKEQLKNNAELRCEKANSLLDQDIRNENEKCEKKWPPKAFRWLQRNSAYRILAGSLIAASAASFGFSSPAVVIKMGFGFLGGVVGGAGYKSGKIEKTAMQQLETIEPALLPREGESEDAYTERMGKDELNAEQKRALIEIYASLTETATVRGKKILDQIDSDKSKTKEDLKQNKIFHKLGLAKLGVDTEKWDEKANELLAKYQSANFKTKAVIGLLAVIGGGMAGGAIFGSTGALVITGGINATFALMNKGPEDGSDRYQHTDTVLKVKKVLEHFGVDEDDIKEIRALRSQNNTKRWLWALGTGALVGGIMKFLPSSGNNTSTEIDQDVDSSGLEKTNGSLADAQTPPNPLAQPQRHLEPNYSYRAISNEGLDQDHESTQGGMAFNEVPKVKVSINEIKEQEADTIEAVKPEVDSDQEPKAPDVETVETVEKSGITLEGGGSLGTNSFTDELKLSGEFDAGPNAAERMATKITDGMEGKGQISFDSDEKREQFLACLSDELKGKYFDEKDGSLIDNGGGYRQTLKDLNPWQLANEVNQRIASGEHFDTSNNISSAELEDIIAKSGHVEPPSIKAPEPQLDRDIPIESATKGTFTALEPQSGLQFFGAAKVSEQELDRILDPNNKYLSKEVSDGLKRLLAREDVDHENFRLSDDLKQLKVKLPAGFDDAHQRGGFYGVELIKDSAFDRGKITDLSELLGGKQPESATDIPLISNSETGSQDIPKMETLETTGPEIPVDTAGDDIPVSGKGEEGPQDIPVYQPSSENENIISPQESTGDAPTESENVYEPSERIDGVLSDEQIREIDREIEGRKYDIDRVPASFKQLHQGMAQGDIISLYKEVQKLLLAQEILGKNNS